VYRYGQGLSQDKKEAACLFAEAAQQGHVRSQCELTLLDEDNVDCFDAIAAEHGEETLFDEGCRRIYQIDQWVESGGGSWDKLATTQRESMRSGIRLWEAAAKHGHVLAQHNLGCLFRNGGGVRKNHKEAVRWFQKAADQGDANAMFDLGNQYERGAGVPTNFEVAKQWYIRAGELGYAAAQHKLGLLLASKSEHKEAVRWLQAATDQGHCGAQCALGAMYRDGNGVPQNRALALKLLHIAADQDHIAAQLSLGLLYHKDGFAKEAVPFLQKAADQGDVDAQYQLGKMFSEGEGLPRNARAALVWLRRASEQGHEMATRDIFLLHDDLRFDDTSSFFGAPVAAAGGTVEDP